MQDKTGHNELPDQFSSYMKLRIEDHRLPVEPEIWTELESQMRQGKRESRIWIGSLLAAALLAGLAWMFFSQQTETTPDIFVEQPLSEITPPEPVVNSKDILSEQNTDSKIAEPRTPISSVPKRSIHPDTYTTEAINSEREEIQNKEIVEEEEKEDKVIQQKNEKERDISPKLNQFLPDAPAWEDLEPSSKKNKRRWLIAATVGTGQNMSLLDTRYRNDELHNDFTNPGYEGNIGIPPPPIINDLMKIEDYSDFKYSLPLSFGITARMPLSERWSIESGLVYTYLSTKMKGRNIYKVDGELNLHYLGIPVNIVANIWKRSNWNIYISGGVMLEKGLSSAYTEKVYYGDRITPTTRRTSIKGIQTSLNGALGFTYVFYNNWGIYLEPKIYYYFDNNQPISTRTDHPFGVGIGAGVRYQF